MNILSTQGIGFKGVAPDGRKTTVKEDAMVLNKLTEALSRRNAEVSLVDGWPNSIALRVGPKEEDVFICTARENIAGLDYFLSVNDHRMGWGNGDFQVQISQTIAKQCEKLTKVLCGLKNVLKAKDKKVVGPSEYYKPLSMDEAISLSPEKPTWKDDLEKLRSGS